MHVPIITSCYSLGSHVNDSLRVQKGAELDIFNILTIVSISNQSVFPVTIFMSINVSRFFSVTNLMSIDISGFSVLQILYQSISVDFQSYKWFNN